MERERSVASAVSFNSANHPDSENPPEEEQKAPRLQGPNRVQVRYSEPVLQARIPGQPVEEEKEEMKQNIMQSPMGNCRSIMPN